MKHLLKYLSFGALLLLLCSCGESDSKDNDTSNSNDKDSLAGEEFVAPEYFMSPEKWQEVTKETGNLYIVNYAGVETEQDAVKMVDSLLEDYPNAGYLWIPDFKSLSGKELYAVFLDKTFSSYYVADMLGKLKKNNDKLYAVRVNNKEERWAMYSAMDIRINGKRSPMILIYAKPEDEEIYAEEGGEDWGWFVNDVSEYFSNNHPQVLFATVYNGGLTEKEIKQIEDELQPEGFGYVFINGNKKGWTGHDMPGSVISSAEEFFGLEPAED